MLWERDDPKRVPLGPLERNEKHPVLLEAKRQLEDYFAGGTGGFTVPLEFRGTEFQKKVWRTLMEIPYGETRTYAWLARRVGNPRAVRAVGAANGRNPLSIIAPCHRVVGSGGALTGFAGGLEVKRLLLNLEAEHKRRARAGDPHEEPVLALES